MLLMLLKFCNTKWGVQSLCMLSWARCHISHVEICLAGSWSKDTMSIRKIDENFKSKEQLNLNGYLRLVKNLVAMQDMHCKKGRYVRRRKAAEPCITSSSRGGRAGCNVKLRARTKADYLIL